MCVGRLWRWVIWGDWCRAQLLWPPRARGCGMARGGLLGVLPGVSRNVRAAVFVGHIAEKYVSLPQSRCGPSPTF